MEAEAKEILSCKNCGQPLQVSTDMNRPGVLHEHGLMRCKPWQSGQPYGLVAELPDHV